LEIELIDVRGLLRLLDGATCNLLKLDCEGAELEIIRSINKELAVRIENILFEPTPSLYDVEELVEHLQSIGYRVGRHKGLYLAMRQSLQHDPQ
jgi:hypothetical protein